MQIVSKVHDRVYPCFCSLVSVLFILKPRAPGSWYAGLVCSACGGVHGWLGVCLTTGSQACRFFFFFEREDDRDKMLPQRHHHNAIDRLLEEIARTKHLIMESIPDSGSA